MPTSAWAVAGHPKPQPPCTYYPIPRSSFHTVNKGRVLQFPWQRHTCEVHGDRSGGLLTHQRQPCHLHVGHAGICQGNTGTGVSVLHTPTHSHTSGET